MAVTSTTIWRVRPSGSNNNGGGFDPTVTSPGTDRSQQNSAQVTFNGTSITATTSGASATITITGYTVISADNGNVLKITGGTNFTVAFYTIISVDTGANTWTLNGNVTTGAGSAMAGAMGGGVTLSGTTSSNPIMSACVPGNTIYILGVAGNATSYPTTGLDYTITGFATPTAGTTAAGYIKWAKDPSGSVPTISVAGLAFYSITRIKFESLYFVFSAANNSTLGCIYGATILLQDCVFNTVGFVITGINLYSGSVVKNCEFRGGSPGSYNATAAGITLSSYDVLVIGCYIYGFGGDGIANTATSNQIENNIIANNRGNGINTASSQADFPTTIKNNTIHGNLLAGISLAGTPGADNPNIFNNIMSNNGTYGLTVTTGSQALNDLRKKLYDYNNYYNNTSGSCNGISLGANDLTVNPQYVNSGGGDFTPTNSSLLVAYPALFKGSITTNYQYIGAVQPACAGGSTIINMAY